MILKLAIAFLQQDNGFGGDFGDEPQPYSLTLGLPFDPRQLFILAAGIVLILVATLIAHAAGKGAAHRRLFRDRLSIAESIYDEIDRALNRALRAAGASQMDRVRELRDLLQARFGHVIALTERPEKARKGLKEALDKDGGEIKTHDSKAAKVRVAKASEEHRVLVWQQLQRFREFWDQKDDVIRLIFAAQGELVVANPRYRLAQLEQEAPRPGSTHGAAAAAAVAEVRAAGATAKAASSSTVRQLEGRYARLKAALAARSAGAVRGILSRDFESIDIHGLARSRDDMISDAQAAASDPYRISKTVVRSVKVAGDAAYVEQVYNLRTRRKAADGATHEIEVETESTDLWLRRMGTWTLRRTSTHHMVQKRDGEIVVEKHREG